MARFKDRSEYFTRHLFGAGLECPVKLFYYAKKYPQNKNSHPFIEHAIYNKRLLTALSRAVFPQGIFVDGDTVNQAADQTQKLLKKKETVLFDAVFAYQNMMARSPICYKKGNLLSVYYVRSKAFDSRKHQITDAKGRINSKWQKYILDFAYQVYLIQKNWSDADIQTILVMPEKSSNAYTDNLPQLLYPLDDQKRPNNILSANQELLAKLDVTAVISKLIDFPDFAQNYLPKRTFEDTIEYFLTLFGQDQKPESNVGLKCKNCEFRIERSCIEREIVSGFDECWGPTVKRQPPSVNHIFDLIGPGTTHRLSNGDYKQNDISLDTIFSPQSVVKGKGRISQEMRQSLQIYKSHGEQVPKEITRSSLYKELERWEYPIHFLDFEAGNYAVPIRKNRRPYHLILFQYSCHTLFKDGSWKHHEWVDDLKCAYPNYELVRRLRIIPNIERGTIVQYSNFERNALKTVRAELLEEQDQVGDSDQLITWLEEIINRNDSTQHQPPFMADLSRLVKNFYYNHKMEDSLSIKDVLRSVMSQSSYLKKLYSQPYSSSNFEDIIWWQSDGEGGARNPYTILTETGDSPIRRGTEAMVVYGRMIARDLEKEKLEAYRNALLKYCELDTLAMLMIYQHWKNNMKER